MSVYLLLKDISEARSDLVPIIYGSPFLGYTTSQMQLSMMSPLKVPPSYLLLVDNL